MSEFYLYHTLLHMMMEVDSTPIMVEARLVILAATRDKTLEANEGH